MKYKSIIALILVIIGAFHSNMILADSIYVHTSDEPGFVKFKIKGTTPSMIETNRIVNVMREKGLMITFSEIDYKPVFCPWNENYFFPCKPFDPVKYDECKLNELQKINRTLTDKQYNEISLLIKKKCYEDTKY